MQELKMSFPICKQCGFSHPPLPDGERCPLSKEEINNEQVDLNPFFTNIKQIIVSQAKKKKVKDIKKLLSNLTLSITKFLELYKE